MMGLHDGILLAQQDSGFNMLVPMVLIFGILYFMMIRPQQRKEKERRAMIAAVKTGDRILFSGGMMGSVTNVKDHSVTVKIAENVKIEIVRGAINRVLDKDDKPLDTAD